MRKETKGMLLTTSGGIAWGINGSLGQLLFTQYGIDNRWLAPVRMLSAGILLLAWCFLRYGKKTLEPWQTKQNAKELIIYGLFGVSCCQFFYFLCIQSSSAAAATILQDLSSLFILGYGCLHEKRLPRKIEVLSIVLALTGVTLMATHGSLKNAVISPQAVVIGLLSAFCVMLYNCIPDKLVKKFPVMMLQGWAFLMGGIFFSCVFRIWTIPYVPSTSALLVIALSVVLGNVIGFTLYISGISLIGPGKGILYAFAEPVTAAAVTAIFFHTAFTVYEAAGFALIFLMLYLISMKDRKKA